MKPSDMRHVYGPVPSRRLGRSLGIDLVPFKVCTYDCIYCQLGRTTDLTLERKAYVTAENIMAELAPILTAADRPDYISLAGSGEPTLNSAIGEVIRRIKQQTEIPVAVLTNGALLWMAEVQQALLAADLVLPSLDAGDDGLFQKINRPHQALSFERMIDGLAAFTRRFAGAVWLEVLLLKGMTGTAAEAWREVWQIYRLPVVVIPTNRPCIRKTAPDRVHAGADAKWAAIVEEVRRVHQAGRPVLVGTRSVRASERLSELLTDAGLEHDVLNAVRHREEAQIIAGAGAPAKITVATNMAGRGTDIKLGEGVAERGGLHVVASERHESGRIDRQLFGRSARQGDPGSAVAIVSLDDELVRRHAPHVAAALRRRHGHRTIEISGPMTRRVFDLAQRKAERQSLRQRKGVLRTDDWLDEYLGFTASTG